MTTIKDDEINGAQTKALKKANRLFLDSESTQHTNPHKAYEALLAAWDAIDLAYSTAALKKAGVEL